MVGCILRANGAPTNQPGASPRVTIDHNPPSPEGAAQRLRAFQSGLIPHVVFIKFDSMFLEQCPQFILERRLTMMFFLGLNVVCFGGDVRFADRAAGIACLPIEMRVLGSVRFQPFGAAFLDFLDDLFQGVVFRERKQRVDMIFNSADSELGAFPFPKYAGLVGIQTFTMVL